MIRFFVGTLEAAVASQSGMRAGEATLVAVAAFHLVGRRGSAAARGRFDLELRVASVGHETIDMGVGEHIDVACPGPGGRKAENCRQEDCRACRANDRYHGVCL